MSGVNKAGQPIWTAQRPERSEGEAHGWAESIPQPAPDPQSRFENAPPQNYTSHTLNLVTVRVPYCTVRSGRTEGWMKKIFPARSIACRSEVHAWRDTTTPAPPLRVDQPRHAVPSLPVN